MFIRIFLVLSSIITLVLSTSLIAKPLTLADFKAEADLRDVSFSPNGRYLASVWNKGVTRSVVIQDLHQNGKQIASFGDEAVRSNSISWANNDRLLLNVSIPVFKSAVKREAKRDKDSDFEENIFVRRLISISPNGTEYVELLDDQSSLSFNYDLTTIYHSLPEDNEHVQICGWVGGRKTLFKVNVYTGKSKIIEKAGKYTYRFLSNKKGELRFRYDWVYSKRTINIYRYTNNKKWKKIDTIHYNRDGDKEFTGEDFASLLDDGSLIYERLNETTGYYELHKRDLEGNTSVFASHPNKDIEGIITDTNGHNVVGYAIEEKDVFRYKYLNADEQNEYAIITKLLVDKGVSGFWILDKRHDSPYHLILTYGQDDPGAYFVYERASQKLKFFGFRHKRLPPGKLGIPAVTNYKARDGQKIKAFLILPPTFKKGEKYPLIMLPHGGPFIRDYAIFDPIAQYLATRGYIVMKPNFRGSTGYGIEFEKSGYRELGGQMIRDIDDGAKFAIKKGLADPKRICIIGGSYGGYAALMGALNEEKLYRCAVSMNGVTHFTKQMKYDKKLFKDAEWIRTEQFRKIGHPAKDKELLDSISPALRANEVNAPILLIGGEDDQRVEFSQQKIMRSALKRAKKEFEFLKIEDAGHSLYWKKDDKEVVFSSIEKFLAKHLQ